MPLRSTLLIFLMINASLSFFNVGCSPKKSTADITNKPIVLVVKGVNAVQRDHFSYSVTSYGRIHPSKKTILAFEIDGRISSMTADIGDELVGPKPLASLDTCTLDARRKLLIAKRSVEETILKRLTNGERVEVVDAQRAIVRRLKAELKRARLDQERMQRLKETGSVTNADYERVLYEYESLQASLSEADARLNELKAGNRKEDLEAQSKRIDELDAEINLLDIENRKATLKAPFDSQVIERFVDEGTVVHAGDPVLSIVSTSTYEAHFSFPVQQIHQAKAVKQVSIGGQNVDVTKVRVVYDVAKTTRTVNIVYELKSNSVLLTGQTCTITSIKKVNEPCVELPLSALVPSLRGLWSCYRLEKIEKSNFYELKRSEVTVLHTDGDRVYVAASLPEPALMVRDGVHKLIPGMRVRLDGESQ